jgi:hypothetical protein
VRSVGREECGVWAVWSVGREECGLCGRVECGMWAMWSRHLLEIVIICYTVQKRSSIFFFAAAQSFSKKKVSQVRLLYLYKRMPVSSIINNITPFVKKNIFLKCS